MDLVLLAEVGPILSNESNPDPETDSESDPLKTQSYKPVASAAARFRYLRPHAKGGLGEVCVAYDSEVNREVALKVIQAKFADDPDSQARFLLEAEVAGGLEHPGIVPVYGLGKYQDGRPFYAMRFIRGERLQQAIERFHRSSDTEEDPRERAIEFRKLLRRFIDVCNAIDYAHSRGVLNRDIKPNNIMLGGHGETLVVDWGLAKWTGRAEYSSTNEPPLLPRVLWWSIAPTQELWATRDCGCGE
jgi:eukaryotic-like serine/threonine-protein kinase